MKTKYTHCTLLNGCIDMEPQPGMTVTVENGRITGIDPCGQDEKGGRFIDLNGRYLMPGLINLHVHLPGGGEPKKKEQDNTKMAKLVMSNPLTRQIGRKICENYAKTELLSGVTTIRTVGGLGDLDAKIRDRILSGKADGPRMLVSRSEERRVGKECM